ncbi:MAG TPA: type II toxin-antitoxin system Phd/YefM family antitoxin [Spirochaetota bacterium]|nr:type II toxin-antitoxin system Phd/YefM family antitoxin [Spirochaetota bacterium]
MKTINATKARENLYRIIDDASASHEPVYITGRRSNAVLLAEDDWKSIQETLYLLSIPKMRDSIHKGIKTPLDECSGDLDW